MIPALVQELIQEMGGGCRRHYRGSYFTRYAPTCTLILAGAGAGAGGGGVRVGAVRAGPAEPGAPHRAAANWRHRRHARWAGALARGRCSAAAGIVLLHIYNLDVWMFGDASRITSISTAAAVRQRSASRVDCELLAAGTRGTAPYCCTIRRYISNRTGGRTAS